MPPAECPFCEIVDRSDPDVREVYRDANVVAFFPTDPAVLGHTLVIPRRHVPDIWSLRTEEAAQLSAAVLRHAEAIRAAVVPEGFNIIQSNGAAATQTVSHLHVHLVPKYRDGFEWGGVFAMNPGQTKLTDAQYAEMIEKIKAAL